MGFAQVQLSGGTVGTVVDAAVGLEPPEQGATPCRRGRGVFLDLAEDERRDRRVGDVGDMCGVVVLTRHGADHLGRGVAQPTREVRITRTRGQPAIHTAASAATPAPKPGGDRVANLAPLAQLESSQPPAARRR